MKRITAFTVAAALVFLLASCSATKPVLNPNESAVSTPSASEMPQPPAPSATPTETPKSSAQIIAELEAQVEQSIRDNMRFDVVSMLPEGEEAERFDINLFNCTESQWMLSVRNIVSTAINTAVDQAKSSIAAGQELQFVNELTAPSWQYLYMLLQMAREDISQYSGYIKSSLSITANAEGESGNTVVTVRVEPVYYRNAISSIVGEDRIAFLNAQSVFDYMNTVFDDNMTEKDYVLPPAEGNLTSGLTWPLQHYIRLRKSWYAPRDDSARKHTGTDIWAREGAEIYSCTAGTVFFVGDWGGGGNTVVVLDDYGYMFYYHHMVSMPDFLHEGQRVEAGQLIGHVGNTGNSSRDHLHLTIAHPDGIIVNPYTYLKAARP